MREGWEKFTGFLGKSKESLGETLTGRLGRKSPGETLAERVKREEGEGISPDIEEEMVQEVEEPGYSLGGEIARLRSKLIDRSGSKIGLEEWETFEEYIAGLDESERARLVREYLSNLEASESREESRKEEVLGRGREEDLRRGRRGELEEELLEARVERETALVERQRKAESRREAEKVKRELGEDVSRFGKLTTGFGAGIVPSHTRDYSLYKPTPTAKPKDAGVYAVPRMGFGAGMKPKGAGFYGGEGLEGMRMGLGTGLGMGMVTSTMPREMALPRGWTREMGLAWTEIKENGDIDTSEHVKDELEQQGVSRGRTALALNRLQKAKAIKPAMKEGETVFVITGTSTPIEGEPGKAKFRGTARPKIRAVRRTR